MLRAKASLPRWNEKYTSRVAVFHQFWRLDTGTEYTVPTVDQLVHEATLLSWLQITIVLYYSVLDCGICSKLTVEM
ncbi:hypothetical protein I7I53_11405 [Histoplasma capsulatum var. duboisii H88]|uniref:Uncharacterized protein n=1 Tax=Ajellomyces capsulatus (strain H88) TaxID=544711 RepID=A0A8A1LF84_AJEC8|nr:hypothetical protein I7I53_11405 [Histoplasma capsulatum var. duboisii H88]